MNKTKLEIPYTSQDDVEFELKKGWNLIGCPSLNEEDVSSVFNEINDSLINVLSYENNTWKSYDPLKNDQLNNLKIMKPGFGYLVSVYKNITLSVEK